MSAPVATEKKEKKGLSKAWRKFKDSFKSDPTSVGTSSASRPAAAKPTTATSTTPAKTEPDKDASSADAAKTTTEPTSTTDLDRRLEKARAIFKKYDFEFNEEDWAQAESRPNVPRERVNKQIRMRVKYTCHNCQSVFGHTKTCAKCQHQRCSECVRYPPKKNKEESKAATTTTTTTTSPPETSSTPAAQTTATS